MSFLWLLVLGGIICFSFAWGIGANDVANAFSTCVGSRSLTLRQAIILAALFEFCGAFFLGQTVANTVRKKIISTQHWESKPEVFALGMFCALTASSLWLGLATKFSLPVSSTHSIIGAIIGFAIVSGGPSSVHWDQVGMIIASWFISPLMGAILSGSFFATLRHTILRSEDAAVRSQKLFPLFVFLVVFVMCLFSIWKGLKKLGLNKIEAGPAIGISLAAGIVLTAVVYFLTRKYVNELLEVDPQDLEKQPAKGRPPLAADVKSMSSIEMDETDGETTTLKRNGNDAETAEEAGTADDATAAPHNLLDRVGVLSADVHDNMDEFERNMAEKSEKFDPRVEILFGYLQIPTACLAIFAHGANDVANAIAPFSAMLLVYETGGLSKKSEIPLWVLALGGIGMVVGLATYGYNIMKTLGVRLVSLTATRGYNIQLATALTVIIGSRAGFPLSTTHIQVGSTIAVGMVEGKKLSETVNWVLFYKTFASWVVTMGIAGLTSAALFSFVAYSPKDY